MIRLKGKTVPIAKLFSVARLSVKLQAYVDGRANMFVALRYFGEDQNRQSMTSDQLGVALTGSFIWCTVTLEEIKTRWRRLILLDLNPPADVHQGRRQDGDAGRRFPIAIAVEKIPQPPITLAIGLNVGPWKGTVNSRSPL
jgi:hypothetical protein